jgi:hypothetical protein
MSKPMRIQIGNREDKNEQISNGEDEKEKKYRNHQ